VTAAGLETLLTLQEHDAALDRLAHRRASLPERETITRGLAAGSVLDGEIRGWTEQHDELAREEQRLDDEARSLHTKAAEVEARMYSGEVSSPKELQAMQSDVEQLRRHQRMLENRELELMEAREPVDAALADLATRRSVLARELVGAQQRLESAETELDTEIANARAARDGTAAGIDAALVGEYERRRARANGVGVARLVGNTCQGCHLTIPASEAERIKKLPEGSLGTCDNCGCILVP
jgi:predicted  nucleic acid-binding Zn-ribbon protein